VAASARRGAQLVSMVQAFAAGSEGRRSSVSVALIVREALAAVRADLPVGVRLRDIAPAHEIQVSADPAQLLQVLVNLLANARDAVTDGGEVRVIWGAVDLSESDPAGLPAGRYAVIDVEDDGPGVPAELRDRIFDPFFTTRVPGNGAGLGLATAASLVGAAGGAMHLLPPGERGARFRVILPFAGQPAAEPPTEAPADRPAPVASGALVLVVDDEPLVREVMARTLQAYGFSTLAACDGAEALALYARDPDAVAVVLTDMTMPGMDGAALIHALRQLDPTLPIVAASGIAANGLRARAAGLGVQGFLPKPFGTEELVAAIRRALAAREA
jgi:two-component system, cell cycle sensor histidine kinase and response regulator CckA